MATASISGDIAIWNLQERRLAHIITGAHDDTIHTCFFYNGLPILLTASSDNSIKQWSFDEMDNTPRLLKSRSGHNKPPAMIKFYGDSGHLILSAGQDRNFCSFSVIRDSQNTVLSQGSLENKARKLKVHVDELKLSQILQFDFNVNKESQWDNVVTCHANDKNARTWSYQRKAIGKHNLPSTDNSPIKSVCISECGNFAFLGTFKGTIDKYNMQSGLHRGTFKGHSNSVTGLCATILNTMVLSVSLDKTLRFWNFADGKSLFVLSLESPVSIIVLSNNNGLAAIASDDMQIRVVDTSSFKVVRIFKGHCNRLTSLAFSNDGKWVISASLDSTIRTWDLATGYMIDAFRVKDIPISISMSPSGEFLASTHVNHVGIFLWANKSQYELVPISRVTQVREANMPLEVPEEEESDWNVPDQTDLIELSTLAKSTWQNLLNLEDIKKRNKPKEPPKAPEKVPFFMNTVAGTMPVFVQPEERVEKKARLYDRSAETVFINKLVEGHREQNCMLI
jgi:U3 small nucleolar RNA-associated protein 21